MTVEPSAGLRVSTASSDCVPVIDRRPQGAVACPSLADSTAVNRHLPLDTRLGIVTLPTTEQNLANITIDISAAVAEDAGSSRPLTVLGITGFSSNCKIRLFRGDKSDRVIVLNPGESIKTLVQCYATEPQERIEMRNNNTNALSTSGSKMFSSVSFGEGIANSPILDASREFTARTRVELPELRAEAPPPSPVGDVVGALALHPALVQYNCIKRANQLGLVLTIHWSITQPSGPPVLGQHSVLLPNIGDSITIPARIASLQNPASLPAAEIKPPVRIIPLQPPVLSHIPTKFGASVGLDLSTGSQDGPALAEGLSVEQATALAEGGQMDVTRDLSQEQLHNCVLVSAIVPRPFSHNFTQLRSE